MIHRKETALKPLHGLLVSIALMGGPALADIVPVPAPPATPDPAAPGEPNGMIRDLYTRYYAALMQASESGGVLPAEFAWPTIADTYFTPELAARFKKALEAEEPVIDWDFFINGQDYGELKVMSVETATIDAVKAEVRITTSNFGNLSVTAISLVNGEAGWKIADFAFLENGAASSTLSGILKESGY